MPQDLPSTLPINHSPLSDCDIITLGPLTDLSFLIREGFIENGGVRAYTMGVVFECPEIVFLHIALINSQWRYFSDYRALDQLISQSLDIIIVPFDVTLVSSVILLQVFT